MKQDSTIWKFRTQNLLATYTLTLRTDFENFPESILDILYIISKLMKLRVQHFKQCANQSWNEEVMVIWRQLHKVEGPFQNDFEIQLINLKSNLWIWNPIQNDPNFKFTHFHFDVLSPLPQELYLEHSICLKWALYD